MILVITGTPGTGKTTLAKKLADELHYKLFDVDGFIEEKKDEVFIEYDDSRQTKIIDELKLCKLIEKRIIDTKQRNLIIESHLAHYISSKIVDICIVLTCDISVLKKRLIKRGYNELKIKENLESESFDEITEEAKEIHKNVIIVDSSKKIDIKELKRNIKK